MPLFAICRGFQEANVALGGTLHQAVHRVSGYADRRDRDEDPLEVQYPPAGRPRPRRPRRLGVGPGDRVVAYMPNIPETLVAFAATASLGAVFASCAPELGARSVVDRLAQLEPTVLLAVDGYGFRDRSIDRREEVATIRAALPTLRHVVHVPYGARASGCALVGRAARRAGPLAFEPVAFDHPLFVLFSSGTTARRRRSCTGTAASCSRTSRRTRSAGT